MFGVEGMSSFLWPHTRHLTSIFTMTGFPVPSISCLSCHSNSKVTSKRHTDTSTFRKLNTEKTPSMTNSSCSKSERTWIWILSTNNTQTKTWSWLIMLLTDSTTGVWREADWDSLDSQSSQNCKLWFTETPCFKSVRRRMTEKDTLQSFTDSKCTCVPLCSHAYKTYMFIYSYIFTTWAKHTKQINTAKICKR